MTEQEWLACTDPTPMLEFVRGMARHRELRLFAAFCHREYMRFRPDITGGIQYEYADTTERYADGKATRREWDRIRHCIHGTVQDANAQQHAEGGVQWAISCCISEWEERSLLASVLRDIFGNPFRPTTINPALLTPTVSNLAHSAYDERVIPCGELDRARLAVLSDALEEAGCDDPEILDHLRGPGRHIRGCWAVDLILGKT